MLRTDDRLLLSEALAAPPGFQVDLLVGTTYSLDLSALLAVPLGLTYADWESADGTPNPDPVAALEAVRRYAERISVFCQAGATAATDHPPLVASWLEDVVVPVKAPLDGVFHPKVWVARYGSTDGLHRYRVVCSSRNLTFDRCWDTVLVVDGEPSSDGSNVSESASLADFVAALPTLATGTCKPGRVAAIAALAEQLRLTRFAPPTGFSELEFLPLGIPGHDRDPFERRRKSRMLVMAPFLGASRLTSLSSVRGDNILISRADELAGIATARLSGFSELYSLDEPERFEERTVDNERLSGLHAKLYVADAGWRTHIWTGSANATTAAFHRNVEFLVRLEGKRADCGIETILGEPGDPVSLRAMLLEVAPRDEPAEPDPRVALERVVDDLAHRLAERSWVATVLPAAEGGAFTVELGCAPPPALPADVVVRCWPLTGGPRLATELDRVSGTLEPFKHQQLAEITAFFAFELSLRRDHPPVVKTILVRADIHGEPEHRRQAILRDLLKDPAQVLRLLRALLAFGPTESDGGDLGLISELRAGRAGRLASETPLLEALLRALQEAPERLDAIETLIDDFKDIQDVFPVDFLALLAPILTVHRERAP